MTSSAPRYSGYSFPSEIISHAVWLYHRFGLSFRDVEDLLAERGITVSYETIRQWCQTFRARLRLDATPPPGPDVARSHSQEGQNNHEVIARHRIRCLPFAKIVDSFHLSKRTGLQPPRIR